MAATDSVYLYYRTQLSSSEVDGQRNWADLVKLACVLLSSTTLGQECVLKEVSFMNIHAFLFDLKPLVVGVIPKCWLNITCKSVSPQGYMIYLGHRLNEIWLKGLSIQHRDHCDRLHLASSPTRTKLGYQFEKCFTIFQRLRLELNNWRTAST